MVSPSALKIDIIFDTISFLGYTPRETDLLTMSERTGDTCITSFEYLRSWVGQEYEPCDSLFSIDKIYILTSDGVTGLKKNGSSGELDFLR